MKARLRRLLAAVAGFLQGFVGLAQLRPEPDGEAGPTDAPQRPFCC
jgi:hypothetical protein